MRRMTWIAGLAAAVVAAGGCGGNTATVPPVADSNLDSSVFDAYDLLRSAGFRVEITKDFQLSKGENPWSVVHQWPPAGAKAEQGSTVEIEVVPGFLGSAVSRDGSSWDREKPLPSLVGMRIIEAVDWLSRNDLGWSIDLPALPATNRRDLLDAYVVRAQDPARGHQVGISYRVYLKAAVTDGLMAQWRDPTVRVPYVGDEELFGAYRRLQARGLRVATDSRLSMGVSQYIRVLGQQPVAGETVPRGTTVTLRLQRRPIVRGLGSESATTVRMKNFVGASLGDAVQWGYEHNLYWELLDAPPLPPTRLPDMLDAYVVSAQSPRPGSMVPQPARDKFGNLSGRPIAYTARLRTD